MADWCRNERRKQAEIDEVDVLPEHVNPGDISQCLRCGTSEDAWEDEHCVTWHSLPVESTPC
jgi:hypothetical protein